MTACLFATDLHGHEERYRKIAAAIERERPGAVFLGGDLLPAIFLEDGDPESGFIGNFLSDTFAGLRARLGNAYPRVFVILGNDDPAREESAILRGQERGLWEYLHGRRAAWREWTIYGYAKVPPSPFRLKDWERYDVSRYVDPGCVSPEDGARTVQADANDVRYGTIAEDLETLAGDAEMERTIFLFHTPPYRTNLDRAALDGRLVDHAPLDVHVGSIAVRRFIERKQPRVTLHGHIHESARLTGSWMDRIGRTVSISAAHDGPELSLVRFDPSAPDEARRELI